MAPSAVALGGRVDPVADLNLVDRVDPVADPDPVDPGADPDLMARGVDPDLMDLVADPDLMDRGEIVLRAHQGQTIAKRGVS